MKGKQIQLELDPQSRLSTSQGLYLTLSTVEILLHSLDEGIMAQRGDDPYPVSDV